MEEFFCNKPRSGVVVFNPTFRFATGGVKHNNAASPLSEYKIYNSTNALNSMKRYITIFIIFLLECSILCAQQNSTLKLVTPQMSQKMYRTIKAYPHVTQLMYHLLKASSTLDGELKIEAISESPNDAKNALVRLCSFLDSQGGEKYMEANLLQGFHFTTSECILAKSMYLDFKNEQVAIENEKELKNERYILKRWSEVGKPTFKYTSNLPELRKPIIKLNLSKVIMHIDSLTANPSIVQGDELATIDFTISEYGEIEKFIAAGVFGDAFSVDNFFVAHPMQYIFEQLDTIIPIPCDVHYIVKDVSENVRTIDITVKYDKKKREWNISPFERKNEILSIDLPIIKRFLDSLPNDDPLRKGRKSLKVKIVSHAALINDKKFPLTRQCVIIEHLKNKTIIDKLSEVGNNL